MVKDLGGVTFNDYSAEVLNAMQDAVLRVLERIGEQAEGYAKDLCPGPESTGQLRNSISHVVEKDENAVYVGSPLEYAAYVELGTGKYATQGKGRPGWWVYVEGSERKGSSSSMKIYTKEEAAQVVAILRSKGLDAHMTEGQEAQPFLAPAVKEHAQTYRNIIEDEMKNG